jgi:hypothetical protein
VIEGASAPSLFDHNPEQIEVPRCPKPQTKDELEAALEGPCTRRPAQGQYHPSIGAEAAREGQDRQAPGSGQARRKKPDAPQAASRPKPRSASACKNEAKLVRIRLTCMNPAKKEWDGEIITAGNAGVGSFKKFVPFNAEEGWHVPRIIFQVLKDRQCPVFYTDKVKNGVTMRRSKLIKEFAIEVLDPLTQEELHDLAQRQAMAKSID